MDARIEGGVDYSGLVRRPINRMRIACAYCFDTRSADEFVCPTCGRKTVSEGLHPNFFLAPVDDGTDATIIPTADFSRYRRAEIVETKPEPARPSAVVHPKHYNAHPSGIECIEVVRHMNFNLGNVVKYLWRADHKGATIEDLKKAAFYLNDEIKLREKRALDEMTANAAKEGAYDK